MYKLNRTIFKYVLINSLCDDFKTTIINNKLSNTEKENPKNLVFKIINDNQFLLLIH